MISINNERFAIDFFPDQTLNMLHFPIALIDCAPKVEIRWNFETLIEQVVLYNIVHHIRNYWPGKPVHLYLPYVPNARMDRTHSPKGEVHTLKWFAKFINDLNFDDVVILDPHSSATETLLDRTFSEIIPWKISAVLDHIDVDYVFFPDKGALDRYKDQVNFTPFYGVKTRNWETGRITDYSVENPANVAETDYADSSILIVDDICSFGYTFHCAANALKAMGFGEINLYVTHCENTVLHGEMINNNAINHIYTTDSIFTKKHPKITVLQQK